MLGCFSKVIDTGPRVTAVSVSVTVRVIVRSGSQWADGSGRLTKNRGGGVWKGQGTSGTCAGTWVGERRE